jgi:hypothetical protein
MIHAIENLWLNERVYIIHEKIPDRYHADREKLGQVKIHVFLVIQEEYHQVIDS